MAVIPFPLTVLFAQLPAAPPPSACDVAHLLDASGQERLAKYVYAQDKWRFVLGRALLFLGLKTLFGMNAPKLSLSPFGRPFLHTIPKSEIDFNISHSGDWVVCAFKRAAQVGVDVVDVNEFDDWQELLNTVLSPLERSHVSTVKPARQQEIVARYWSIKEAVLKCVGVGLQIDPLNITIDLRIYHRPQVKKCPLSITKNPGNFCVMSFNFRSNATLSVVTKGFGATESNANVTKCVPPRIKIIPVNTLLSSVRCADH
jgi:phosphopantetheine--protein transferase-like protein